MSYAPTSQKMDVTCPKCTTAGEVLWFPSNKVKIELPGTRSGKTTAWSGRGETVEGACSKCWYKFTEDDL